MKCFSITTFHTLANNENTVNGYQYFKQDNSFNFKNTNYLFPQYHDAILSTEGTPGQIP